MNNLARELVRNTTLNHISTVHAMEGGKYALKGVHLVLGRPPADFVTDQPPKDLKAPKTREAWLQTDYSKLIAAILKEQFEDMKVEGLNVSVRPLGESGNGRLHVDPARIVVTAINEKGKGHLMALKNALGNNGVWILNNKSSRRQAITCLHLGQP